MASSRPARTCAGSRSLGFSTPVTAGVATSPVSIRVIDRRTPIFSRHRSSSTDARPRVSGTAARSRRRVRVGFNHRFVRSFRLGFCGGFVDLCFFGQTLVGLCLLLVECLLPRFVDVVRHAHRAMPFAKHLKQNHIVLFSRHSYSNVSRYTGPVPELGNNTPHRPILSSPRQFCWRSRRKCHPPKTDPFRRKTNRF